MAFKRAFEVTWSRLTVDRRIVEKVILLHIDTLFNTFIHFDTF